MNENELTWKNVEELFNSSIKKLSSYSAEVKLLSTPELVKLYISKYRLYSDSAVKLLSTPELVNLYISRYSVSKDLFEKIILQHKQ